MTKLAEIRTTNAQGATTRAFLEESAVEHQTELQKFLDERITVRVLGKRLVVEFPGELQIEETERLAHGVRSVLCDGD
jgi:hypothetical protein